ncbi:MAG: hypothetical protein WDW36_003220 [Sanguina aurantia]
MALVLDLESAAHVLGPVTYGHMWEDLWTLLKPRGLPSSSHQQQQQQQRQQPQQRQQQQVPFSQLSPPSSTFLALANATSRSPPQSLQLSAQSILVAAAAAAAGGSGSSSSKGGSGKDGSGGRCKEQQRRHSAGALDPDEQQLELQDAAVRLATWGGVLQPNASLGAVTGTSEAAAAAAAAAFCGASGRGASSSGGSRREEDHVAREAAILLHRASELLHSCANLRLHRNTFVSPPKGAGSVATSSRQQHSHAGPDAGEGGRGSGGFGPAGLLLGAAGGQLHPAATAAVELRQVADAAAVLLKQAQQRAKAGAKAGVMGAAGREKRSHQLNMHTSAQQQQQQQQQLAGGRRVARPSLALGGGVGLPRAERGNGVVDVEAIAAHIAGLTVDEVDDTLELMSQKCLSGPKMRRSDRQMLLLLLPRLGLRQLLRLTPSLAVDMEVAMGLLAAVATRIAGPAREQDLSHFRRAVAYIQRHGYSPASDPEIQSPLECATATASAVASSGCSDSEGDASSLVLWSAALGVAACYAIENPVDLWARMLTGYFLPEMMLLIATEAPTEMCCALEELLHLHPTLQSMGQPAVLGLAGACTLCARPIMAIAAAQGRHQTAYGVFSAYTRASYPQRLLLLLQHHPNETKLVQQISHELKCLTSWPPAALAAGSYLRHLLPLTAAAKRAAALLQASIAMYGAAPPSLSTLTHKPHTNTHPVAPAFPTPPTSSSLAAQESDLDPDMPSLVRTPTDSSVSSESAARSAQVAASAAAAEAAAAALAAAPPTGYPLVGVEVEAALALLRCIAAVMHGAVCSQGTFATAYNVLTQELTWMQTEVHMIDPTYHSRHGGVGNIADTARTAAAAAAAAAAHAALGLPKPQPGDDPTAPYGPDFAFARMQAAEAAAEAAAAAAAAASPWPPAMSVTALLEGLSMEESLAELHASEQHLHSLVQELQEAEDRLPIVRYDDLDHSLLQCLAEVAGLPPSIPALDPRGLRANLMAAGVGEADAGNAAARVQAVALAYADVLRLGQEVVEALEEGDESWYEDDGEGGGGAAAEAAASGASPPGGAPNGALAQGFKQGAESARSFLQGTQQGASRQGRELHHTGDSPASNSSYGTLQRAGGGEQGTETETEGHPAEAVEEEDYYVTGSEEDSEDEANLPPPRQQDAGCPGSVGTSSSDARSGHGKCLHQQGGVDGSEERRDGAGTAQLSNMRQKRSRTNETSCSQQDYEACEAAVAAQPAAADPFGGGQMSGMLVRELTVPKATVGFAVRGEAEAIPVKEESSGGSGSSSGGTSSWHSFGSGSDRREALSPP